MEISKKEWNWEEDRVARVKKIISEQLNASLELKENVFKQGMEITKDYWENDVKAADSMYDLKAIVDITQNIQSVQKEQRKLQITDTKVKALKRLEESLYFGRIDFKEEGELESEKIYIGSDTLMDDLDILVYDWRSPVCGMFYEYELGEGEYSCPDGVIKGEIGLKRQYGINKGKIQYMFNTDMKIDDEMLQKNLSGSCDDNMRSIIKTIQKEQNRIIRSEDKEVLVVQGPAGSGKTSIALHRAAYILYKYKDRGLKSDNIIIFSPNDVFNDYISEVLPELGEDKIEQSTFMEYADLFLPDWLKLGDSYEQMEEILGGGGKDEFQNRKDSIVFKGSLEFEEIISKYIKHMEEKRKPFRDIDFGEWTVITGKELDDLYNKTYSKWPIKSRYDEMFKDIKFRFRKEKYEKQIREKMESEYYEKNEHCYEGLDDLDAQVSREVSKFFSKCRKILSVNEKRVYENLLGNTHVFKKLSRGMKVPKDINKILRDTQMRVRENNILFEDITPLLYIKYLLGHLENMNGIKHVIIDEGQDYTPLQYKLFSRMFKGAGFTIVGDINQSINPYTSTKEHSLLGEVFKDRKTSIMEIKKSYRSTKEISDFTKRIISNGDITNVSREGEKPKTVKVNGKDDMLCKVKDEITHMLDNGCESIGIICRGEKDAERFHKRITEDGNHDINLMKKDQKKFQGGINVVPSYMAKGLEFDGVIVLDAGSGDYHREEERLLFYTICTRALHRLSLFYTGEMTKFIKE